MCPLDKFKAKTWKNQSLSMILEEENGEDLTIFKGEKNTHHVDMMGHVIHILHIFFIFVS
jgi:hypothetical protein